MLYRLSYRLETSPSRTVVYWMWLPRSSRGGSLFGGAFRFGLWVFTESPTNPSVLSVSSWFVLPCPGVDECGSSQEDDPAGKPGDQAEVDPGICQSGVVNLVVGGAISGVFVPGVRGSVLRGGGHSGARDVVPGHEAGGHLGPVGGCSHPVATRPEVG